MFGFKETKFVFRHKCFGLTKVDSEDFATFATQINKHAEKFDIENCTADDFKVLLFISGLKSPQDSLILKKLLTKIDNQYVKIEASTAAEVSSITKLNLQILVNEAERLICLKKDKGVVGEPLQSCKVKAIQVKKSWNKLKNQESGRTSPTPSTSSSKPSKGSRTPRRPCPYCAGNHFVIDCDFTYKICKDCKQMGHKSGFCSSAAEFKEKRKANRERRSSDPGRVNQVKDVETSPKTERKFVLIQINSAKVKLQLNCASDITVISHNNRKKLGTPQLKPCNSQSTNASGHTIDIWGYLILLNAISSSTAEWLSENATYLLDSTYWA